MGLRDRLLYFDKLGTYLAYSLRVIKPYKRLDYSHGVRDISSAIFLVFQGIIEAYNITESYVFYRFLAVIVKSFQMQGVTIANSPSVCRLPIHKSVNFFCEHNREPPFYTLQLRAKVSKDGSVYKPIVIGVFELYHTSVSAQNPLIRGEGVLYFELLFIPQNARASDPSGS
jgi:hypothetical protein